MVKIVPSFGPFAGGTTVTVVLSDAEGFDTNTIAVTMETNDQKCTNARYERQESPHNAQINLDCRESNFSSKQFLNSFHFV